jgi:hypothetical protein
VNGVLDTGEDVNGNGNLETYGATPQNIPAGAAAPFDAAATPWTAVPALGGANPSPALVARANRQVFFRRALKLVNGGQNQLPPGLTVASENPLYVQGHYNASVNLAPTEAHVPAAVVADAVTLLSTRWNDIRSFTQPMDSTQRPAATTAYRMALLSGKTLAFPKPGWAAASFGSDGGAHNFVRNLEDWNLAGVIQRYRGSFVSFFISRQGTGSFKCCNGDSYVRGDRSWTFDSDFLTPSLLPPGTPMFRDMNTLTFRQLLRPTQ